MKILHIVPTYTPAYRYGGPIASVHTLNKWLVKKGVDVTVYTTNIDGSNDLDVPLDKPVSLDGVKVFYFKSSFPRSWFYSSVLRRALAENMKDFDLVHITSVFLAASTLGAHYAKKFKKPYIISPRGSLMKEPLTLKSGLKKFIYLALIEKRNLRNAAAIHFTSEVEKKEYLDGKLPLKKAIFIPNAFDPSEFQSYDVEPRKIGFREKFNIGADKKTILFLGRINWKKGFDTLIPAFAEVLRKEPEALLVIAGNDDENYKKEVESKIINCKLKISKDVIFTGMLLGDDKISAFRDAQVFVLPSYSENFGMSVLEALYFGVPVIISENVGLSGTVKEAEAGFVVKKDVFEVVRALEKVLHGGNSMRAVIRNGEKLLREYFSAEAIAVRFLKEYGDLTP